MQTAGGSFISTAQESFIKRNRTEIIQNLHVDASILAALKTSNIVTAELYARLQTAGTDIDRNTLLLDHLLKCSQETLDSFISILQKTKCGHIAKLFFDAGATGEGMEPKDTASDISSSRASNASDTQLISGGQRRQIERNRPNIIKYLRVDVTMISTLQAASILSSELAAHIQAIPVDCTKISVFLDSCILKLSQGKLDTFINILEESDQRHVVELFKYESDCEEDIASMDETSSASSSTDCPRESSARPKLSSRSQRTPTRKSKTFSDYNEQISAEKWQRVLRDMRDSLVCSIDLTKASFLERCKDCVLTGDDLAEISGKAGNIKGYTFIRILREKTFNEFENFIQILKMYPDYKVLGMRLQHSALPNDVSDENIRREIHDLIGEYVRMKRPSDRSFKEMEDALVSHYKGLRKTKIEHLCERTEDRNIKAEGICQEFAKVAKESRQAKNRKEESIGRNETKQKFKEMKNLMEDLRQDIEIRDENIEDRLNEMKATQMELAELKYIKKLHDKQNYLEGLMENMQDIMEKMSPTRDHKGSVSESCSQALDEEIRSLQNTSNTQAEQIKRLLKDREKLSKDNEEQFDTMQEQIQQDKAQLKSLKEEIEESQKRIRKDEDEIKQLKDNNSILAERIKLVLDEHKKLQEDLEVKIKDFNEVKSKDRDQADVKIKSMKDKVSLFEEQELKQEGYISQINEENMQLKERIQEMKKGYEDLKEEHSNQLKTIDELIDVEYENGELIEEKKELKDDLDYYKAELKSIKKEQRELEEDLEEAETKCNQQEKLIDSYLEKNTNLEADNRLLKTELDKHRKNELRLPRIS